MAVLLGPTFGYAPQNKSQKKADEEINHKIITAKEALKKELKDFGDLSAEERGKFLRNNPALIGKSNNVVNQAYKNGLYIKKFGKEQFDKIWNADVRNKQYDDTVIAEAFSERYGDDLDDFYGEEGLLLTTDAMKFAIDNDYITAKEFENTITNPVGGQILAEKAFGEFMPYGKRSAEKDHAALLEDLFIVDNNATLNRPDVKYYEEQEKSRLNEMFNQGQSKEVLDSFYDTFNQRTENNQPYFPYFSAYKDSYQLNGLGDTEKIDLLSKYNALKLASENASSDFEKQVLTSKAIDILNSDFQHIVHEETTGWDNFKKTIKGVGTKIWSSLGETATGLKALYLRITDEDAYNHYILGQDSDGNELPWYDNMRYWTDVNQYNSWTVAGINEARENGGISTQNLVRDVGETYDLLTWETVSDAFQQFGYVAEQVGVDYALTAGGGAAIKATERAALRGLLKAGVDLNKVNKAYRVLNNPITDLTSDVARLGLHSVGESALDASIAAEEIYLNSKAKAEEYKNSDEFNNWLNQETAKLLDAEFPDGLDEKTTIVRNVNTEFGIDEVKSNTVKRTDRELEIKQELIDKYDSDAEEAAIEAAGKGYSLQATTMMLKNSLLDASFKAYTFAKPLKSKIRATDILDKKKVIVKNGVFEAKHYTWKDFALGAGKTMGGGALEEFTDNLTHQGAVALGLNYTNNWIAKNYTGDDVAKAALYTSNVAAYFSGVEDAMYDRGTYLEAGIGAFSPFIMGGPRAVTSAFKYGVGPNAKANRAALKDLTALQKINVFWYNPLIQNALQDEAEFIRNKQAVNAVNEVIEKHGDDFKSIATGLHLIDEFNNVRDAGETVDIKDEKFALAFNFARELETLAKAGNASPLYNAYITALTNAAKGKIDRETVASYQSEYQNKNISHEQGQEEALDSTLKNIQENAKKLIGLVKEYQETKRTISDYTKGKLSELAVEQLTYQAMLANFWKDRISEMEKEITGNSAVGTLRGTGQLNEHGMKEITEQYQKAIDTLNEDVSLFHDVKEKRNVYKKLRKKYMKELSEYTPSNYTGTVLTAEEILALNPEQRELMIANHSFYTEEQVEEIEKAEGILAQRDPDYRSKVRDIATLQRRSDVNRESYRILLDNPDMLITYEEYMQRQAGEDAITALKRLKTDQLINSFDVAHVENPESMVDMARDLSSEMLQNIIDARPSYYPTLQHLLERAKTIDVLNSIVDSFDVSGVQKSALKDTLSQIIKGTNTSEGAINAIEDFIDNAGDSAGEITLREQMNEILNRINDYNIVRDATRVENRGDSLEKARKRRERLDKKAEYERKRREKRKAEKAEAERKAKEEELKRRSEKMNGQMEESSPDLAEHTEFEGKVEEEIAFPETVTTEYNPNIEEVKSPSFVATTATIEPEQTTESDEEIEPTSDTSEATQLRGNVLTPYNISELKEGVIKEKKADGWLKDFFDWMSNAGIRLQEIIDYELADIAKLNPTVHYMMAINANNATHDNVLADTPLLVVEATDKVKKLHKEERGGIIKANGKEWLVIGTMGYYPDSNEKIVWQKTLNRLQANRSTYFAEHPTERFTVDSKFETSIKQLALGRLINQLANDPEVVFRSISELLADPARNPYGLQWKDLSFAIQMATGGFELSRSVDGTVYAPKRYEENAGNVFLMVKASNGNYVPAFIRPTFTDELRPGELKDTIDALLMQLINTDHKVRFEIISQLKFLLNLNDSDNILIGTATTPIVSIKQNGVVVDTIDLRDENLNRAEAFKRLQAGRFRVQITKNNLIDVDRLKQLDEAGALTTDLALLATAGGHYTVYASDMETGKPIDQQPLHTDSNSVVRGSALNSAKDPAQLVDGKIVRFHNGVWVNEAGKQITDPTTLQKIDMLNNIESNNIPVAYTDKQGRDMYIISSAEDNPIVASVDKSHNITIYTGRNAQNAIDYYNSSKEVKVEDVEIEINEIVQKDNQEPTVVTQEETTPVTKKETVSKEKVNKSKTFTEVSNENSSEDLHNSKNLLTFVNIITNPTFGKEIRKAFVQIAKEKGWALPELSKVDAFLQEKGIPMPSDMTKEAVDTWLDMIRNCK